MNENSKIKADRRSLVKGIASLPLATVLANKALAEEVAATLDDITITTPSGREVSAALAVPETTPAPGLLVFHEWWGLNDEVKTAAAEYAKEGFLALAVDLYEGESTDQLGVAAKLSQGIRNDPAPAGETVVAWADWIRADERFDGKLGTVGWCFGGGWSLNTSIATPVDATVVYYGNVAKTADDVSTLQGPVLGHFGTEDRFINEEMVGGFEAAMNEAEKTFTTHWYTADHAFANPSSAVYDEEDAQVSWGRTLEFLKENLMASS